MTHPIRSAEAALAAIALLFLPACSSITGDDYGKARFVISPDGGADPITITVEAKYHSPATGDCHLEIYDIEGDNKYIQFSPFGIGSICEGTFDAQIRYQSQDYMMFGNVLRDFGSSTNTPFASGTYSSTSGGFGTFIFYEDELADLN